ncbi:hypothetical protein L211DRAFT_407253 [Terfezia boudieri ATCC MYA-4762]|uniref:Uncharacterized protein n=1 Tax=Terfezia boudieri ATCC MYA-4762 TaxID=1051890 RepID=A0A3N4LG09_9PEZI|nr:hypothetical protein L211DRAFT_407253 [Terfezia boudieri ATCC MYA-4762]
MLIQLQGTSSSHANPPYLIEKEMADKPLLVLVSTIYDVLFAVLLTVIAWMLMLKAIGSSWTDEEGILLEDENADLD